MTGVVVVGAQWGDEGKGKIVDWLSEDAEVVVRFQGGHNAGHTLVIDGVTHKLSLLPSGIVRANTLSIIGNGVVVNPWALLDEINTVKKNGVAINPEKLVLSDHAHLILPVHEAVDKAQEVSKGKNKIGTTGRGIGPTYEDKVARRGIRVCDLRDPDLLREKINTMLVRHNATLKGFDADPVDGDTLFNELMEIAPDVLVYARHVPSMLNKYSQKGAKILFEGAQGIMLDIDHGTYPFVTSSNTCAAQASSGSGLGPKSINYVLGIAKAYTTRVGEGPFPTEQENEIGEKLGQLGHEFGTVTGRKRRCGWFDAVMVRQAVQLNGIDGIALTKLDVLDSFEEVKICIGYELNGERLDYFPSGQSDQAHVKPVYETHRGWMCSTVGSQTWNDLPAEAIKYIKRLEELIGANAALVSTSPERKDTLMVLHPFQDGPK